MMNIFSTAEATKYFQTKFSPQLGVARWRLMTFDGPKLAKKKEENVFLLFFCYFRLLGGVVSGLDAFLLAKPSS
jgi:hypothetical protein